MNKESKKNYRVVLNGINYLLDFDGVPTKMGFYVTRYVEATNSDEAELIAVDSVRNIDRLNQALLNDDSDPPKIILDEMYEIESFDELEAQEPGIGFYYETDEEE